MKNKQVEPMTMALARELTADEFSSIGGGTSQATLTGGGHGFPVTVHADGDWTIDF